MTPDREIWGGSLHLTFRLLSRERQSAHITPMLESDGLTRDQILAKLPYEASRALGAGRGEPDERRYRDLRHFYQTVGLVFERPDQTLAVTELGRTTLRWLPLITEQSAPVLGKHAAYALSAIQLRNPSRAGSKYSEEVEVFPCAFIWRAMVALDGRLSSDELNREILWTNNEEDIERAIAVIAEAREKDDPTLLGPEAISGPKKNDRIVTWISLASFGYTLIQDKNDDPDRHFYRIAPACRDVLEQAAAIRRQHREFSNVADYVEYLSRQAGLPPALVS
jgi:hypothetical protein